MTTKVVSHNSEYYHVLSRSHDKLLRLYSCERECYVSLREDQTAPESFCPRCAQRQGHAIASRFRKRHNDNADDLEEGEVCVEKCWKRDATGVAGRQYAHESSRLRAFYLKIAALEARIEEHERMVADRLQKLEHQIWRPREVHRSYR